MADNILGFIATIDVTDLKAGLSQVKKAINQTKTQFESATSTMENWQKSTEGLSAKITQLRQQFSAQEKVIEAYSNEIERVKNLQGDHSKQLEILNAKLEKAKTTLNKTKVQLDKYSKSFEDLKKKQEEENSANSKLLSNLEQNKTKLKSLENQYKSIVLKQGKFSKEAKELANQIKKTNKEINNQEKQVDKLDKAYKSLSSKSFENLGKNLTKAFASVGTAIAGALSKLASISDETKEFRDNQTRLETTFNDVGLSTKSLTDNYTKLYGAIGKDDQITEALSFLAQLGVGEEDLGNYTETLIGIYAKFGDAIPINELSQNINQAIKTGEVTGQLSDALEQVGYNTDNFKNYLALLDTEEKRQQHILGTLDSTYTKLGKQFLENNDSLISTNLSQLNYNKTLSKFGDLGDSVKKQLIELKTRALETLYPVIQKVLNFVKNNEDTIKKYGLTIAGIGGTIVVLSKAISAWNTITKTATALQTVFNAVLNANPIGLLVTAVAGVTAGAILLIKNWEKVKDFFANFWNSIRSFVEPIADKLKSIFSIDNIKESWEKLLNFFKEIPNKIGKFFTDAWNKVKEIWSNPGEFFTNVFNGIVECFKELPSKLWEVGKNAITKLGDAMVSGWNAVRSWFSKNGDIQVNEEEIKKQSEEYYKTIRAKDTTADDKEAEAQIKIRYLINDDDFERVKEYFNNDLVQMQNSFEEILSKDKTGGTALANFVNEISTAMQRTTTVVEEETEKQITITEKGIEEQLRELNEKFNTEIELAKNPKESEEVVKKYQTQLKTIKDHYADQVKVSGEANTEIQKQIDETDNKLNNSIQKETKTLKEKINEVMKPISEAFDKWGGLASKYLSAFTSVLNDYWQQQLDSLDNEYEAYCEELEKEQEALEESLEKKNEEIEEAKQEELDELAKQYKKGLITEKQYFLQKEKINEKYQDEVDKNTKESAEYAKKLEDEKLAKEQEILREKNEINKKQFEAQKANDIAQVWIQAALAIVKAWATLGPIGAAVATGVITALAGVQTATISKQQYTPITALAEGGVVDNPTYALVGEAGKEAVMPLENNTGWIGELAEKLNDLMKKDFNINNYGMTPSGAVYYNTNNNYNYNQTINSPKNLTRSEIYKDSKNLLSLKKYV